LDDLSPLVFVLDTWDNGWDAREDVERAAANLRRLLVDQQVDCDFATTAGEPGTRALSVPDIGRLVVSVFPAQLSRLLASIGRFMLQGGGKIRIEIDLAKGKAVVEGPASTSPGDIQLWVASAEHALKRGRTKAGR
jgi:hypothetical protein